MTVKNLLTKKLSFIDGNVRFDSITLSKSIEAWKIFIKVGNISQKNKSPFKIKAKLANTVNKGIGLAHDIFEFDDSESPKVIIFGNPFEKDNTLVDYISFEYFDYLPMPLVYFWHYVYEVDEGTREDLFPFSNKQ
jgi:hypothetical protein